jgi:hypothetical protein
MTKPRRATFPPSDDRPCGDCGVGGGASQAHGLPQLPPARRAHHPAGRILLLWAVRPASSARGTPSPDSCGPLSPRDAPLLLRHGWSRRVASGHCLPLLCPRARPSRRLSALRGAPLRILDFTDPARVDRIDRFPTRSNDSGQALHSPLLRWRVGPAFPDSPATHSPRLHTRRKLS